MRAEALEIARRLLLDGGPGAITLKAIGAEMGMSHANLIHHFGSADALQTRLREVLVGEIASTVRTLLEGHARDGKPLGVVDRVFDAYASGGLGLLVAWSALARAGGGDAGELTRAFDELTPVLEAQVSGPDAAARAREVLRLVTLLAFAESILGPALSPPRAGAAGDPRNFTRRLLHLLALEPAVAPNGPPGMGGSPAND